MPRLLNTLEKHLKIDMRYLLSGGAWLFTGQGIQVLSGLVMTIVFANFLPKESFGTYQFIMSAAAILGVLTLGMAIPVKRAASKGIDGSLRFGFRTQLKWSIGIFILGGLLASYYFYNDNHTLGKAFLVIGTLSPFIGSFSLFKSYLHGKQKFKESALLGFWLRPVLIITMLTTVYFTDDPFMLVLVYFSTSFVSTGILYLLTISRYSSSDTTLDSFPLNYAKHLTFLGVITTVGNHAEKLLIFHFLGAAQVAVYAIAMLPTTHLLRLYVIIGDLIFPKFTQHAYTTIKEGMLRKIILVFMLSVILVAIFIFSAPFIYMSVFPAYPEAILLSQLAILALLTKFGNLFMQAFSSHEMKKEQYIIRTSGIFLKIVSLLILIPLFGLFGAIYAFLITHIYWIILSAVLFYIKK